MMPDSFDSRPSPPRTRARSQRARGPARSLHAGGPRSEEDHGARTSHGLFCDFLITFSVTSKPHKTAYLQLQLGGGGGGVVCVRGYMSFSSLIPQSSVCFHGLRTSEPVWRGRCARGQEAEPAGERAEGKAAQPPAAAAPAICAAGARVPDAGHRGNKARGRLQRVCHSRLTQGLSLPVHSAPLCSIRGLSRD